MGYFERREFVSNSDLTALKQKLNLIPERDLKAAYAMGSLVDAMLTEEDQVEALAAELQDDDIKKAELMAIAGKQDATVQLYLEGAKFQHEIYKNAFPVEYEGFIIYIPIRCKLDILKRSFRAGADFKTTACASLAAFIKSIFLFDYDRQAALYMDAAGLDYFMIIGISKKLNKITRKHDVYKFAVRRGDETYNSGKRKFNFLAYNYNLLILSLNL